MRSTHTLPQCPLCNSDKPELFFEDKHRKYLQCLHCMLVFVPKEYWLSAEEEKAVYGLHENSPGDQGYRKFLSRLTEPLMEKLEPEQKGLDFVCGPGPALYVILEEQGHKVLNINYDFICATEVVEHMHNPSVDFSTMFGILKSGGWLGIMTKLVIDKPAFSKWHYIQDLTHICFYSLNIFEYLAVRFNAELEFTAKDVILLKKREQN